MIVSVINQKGGVGKSTTAHCLGAGLARRGKRVLFVDLDPQCNLTITLGVGEVKASVLDVLMRKSTIQDAIVSVELGDVLASNPSLAVAESLINETGKEFRLKEALESVADKYDYVVIDTPPALGVLTVNALTASNKAVVPAMADVYSVHGITQLVQTVESIKKYCNQSLQVDGVLLTKYSPRTVISRDMLEVIAQPASKLGAKIYDTKIRECVAIREAQCLGCDVFSYAPKSNASVDYNGFIDEFLKG